MPEMIFSVPTVSAGGGVSASAPVFDDGDAGGAEREGGVISTVLPLVSITRSESLDFLPDGFAVLTPSGAPSAKCTCRLLIGFKPPVLRINFHAAS